ncbi:MAG TPA: zinc ribbon domain-containing protein [Actinomycetota bacterium]|nr:zinc ribbon domain-containing protein [Actinomycetota bacterium]
MARGDRALRRLQAKVGRAKQTYVRSGLVHCGLCGRRMGAQMNRERKLYRCRFPAEYAMKAELDHPRSVAVGESLILAELRDCDHRIAKLRSALEADADPALVAGWIAEVQGERLGAELLAQAGGHGKLSREELEQLVRSIDVRKALRTGSAAAKRDLYAELGITLTFDPKQRVATVEAAPGHASSKGWSPLQGLLERTIATLSSVQETSLPLPRTPPVDLGGFGKPPSKS